MDAFEKAMISLAVVGCAVMVGMFCTVVYVVLKVNVGC